jgi:creatinine amidohydrolase
VAPSIPYGYYPPFIEYPGSTTLPLSVARDLITNICRSYARTSRARRFYVVAHGQISRPVFEQAARQLATEGVLLRYSNWEAGKAASVRAVRTQERGSHADEIETSMLLHVAPGRADMTKALREYGAPPSPGGYMIGNRPERDGLFSPSGVFGDATAATPEKGQRITDALIAFVLKDVEDLRSAPLPEAATFSAVVDDLAGRYAVAPGDTITVSREDDLLAVDRPGKPRVRLQSAGPHRFGLWTTEVRFLLDDRGTVTHLVLSADGRDVLARRVP